MSNLSWLIHSDVMEYGFRSIIVIFYALLLFKVSNTRLFGQLAAFDLIIFIMLGDLFGEAIIDKEHFISALTACTLITFLHKLLALVAFKYKLFNKYLKGEQLVIYKKGKWNLKNMHYCRLTQEDVYQDMRCSNGATDLTEIKEICLERNGKLSFLKNKRLGRPDQRPIKQFT